MGFPYCSNPHLNPCGYRDKLHNVRLLLCDLRGPAVHSVGLNLAAWPATLGPNPEPKTFFASGRTH